VYLSSVALGYTETPIADEVPASVVAVDPGTHARTGQNRAGQMQAFQMPSAQPVAVQSTPAAQPVAAQPMPAPQQIPVAPRAQASAQLLIYRGNGAGTRFPLGNYNIVGSQTDCQVVLTDPHVAAQHLELQLYQGVWYARDLGSSSGTVKSGQPLGPNAVAVAENDWFSLGPSLVVTFETTGTAR
jgi:hypothetical protein